VSCDARIEVLSAFDVTRLREVRDMNFGAAERS
jgi:hypothetical protein